MEDNGKGLGKTRDESWGKRLVMGRRIILTHVSSGKSILERV